MTRIENEKRVITRMVKIYCRHKEGNSNICPDCEKLLDYAHQRLSGCRYSEDKPTCRKCPIHCYKPDMRDKIRVVMRHSEPRMLLYSPLTAIRHIIREIT